MTFDWNVYINLSKKCLECDEEAYFRTAISRAYYGCFCILRDRENLGDDTTRNVHINVIKHYKNHRFNPNYKKIGIKLDQLRKCRNKADYNGEIEITKDNAELAIARSKEIINLLY
jgi:uncharacterized protein (UPF0332 family)